MLKWVLMISLTDWQSSSVDDGGGSEKVVMVVVLFVARLW